MRPRASPKMAAAASFLGRRRSIRPPARRRRRWEKKKRSNTAPGRPFAVFEAAAAMHDASRQWHAQDLKVGLVPTMGALHAGHLSLIEAARAENEFVVVSIFVNPIQFGPGEDFARYPRDPAHDEALLSETRVDAVYRPSVDVMYPPGSSTRVHVSGVADPLEGAAPPGHFQGVAPVASKLFTAVQPDRPYLRQKVGQQTAVDKRFTRAREFPGE